MTTPTRPRIYTKTGDTGETGLFDGTRVSKADPRVEAYGDIDELAASLGVARAASGFADLDAILDDVQRDLFALGARLADPAHRIAARVTKTTMDEARIHALERHIDTLERELPPLRKFILAGGAPGGAMLHMARAICRRAERHVVRLGSGETDPIAVMYLNRLSDLLFVMARAANARAGVPEIEW